MSLAFDEHLSDEKDNGPNVSIEIISEENSSNEINPSSN